MMSAVTEPDSELFCTAAKTQSKPERHPSTLVPGGHASPLRHPTVLRPGAGQHHHQPHVRQSSENLGSQTPKPTGQQAPKPIYRAYSPANASQSPRASVVAGEIEGYFTALDVPPLHIQKQAEPLQPAPTPATGRESPVQRCSSPPVPPKVKIEEAQPCENGESSQPPAPARPETPHEDSTSEPEAPPAYDESERVTPPPEKTRMPSRRPLSRDDNLPAAAAVPAAHVGGSVAGVDTDEATAPQPDPETSHEDGPATEAQDTAVVDSSISSVPPPLPPRSTSVPQEIQPDSPHMPGSYPPPPKRSSSPRASSPQDGAAGAAASSATAVGAAVAMPSSDFAHNGLRQARNALGKHMKHMVDKAKEHHEQHLAKKSSASRSGFEDGKSRNILVVAPIA